MQYFDHSTRSANDSKIMQLRIEQGGAAVDAYWYIIEQIHSEERPLCVRNASAMRVHTHALCTDSDTLEKWLDSMISSGLLFVEEDGESVSSKRAKNNIMGYQEKSQKSRKAAKSRWENADAMQPHSGRNATAKRTQSGRNANKTKQNKTKESKAIKSFATPSASRGAAADKAAPPATEEHSGLPRCRVEGCDGSMRVNLKSRTFTCDKCGVELTLAEMGG